MQLLLSLLACLAGAIIGQILAEILTCDKKDRAGKNLCTTCEHCMAIDGDGYRVTTESCPLEYNSYSYPVTCTCYKPRKEEIED